MACTLVRAAFHRSMRQAHILAVRSAVASRGCRNAASPFSPPHRQQRCTSSLPAPAEQQPVIAELEQVVRSVCAKLYPGHASVLPEGSPIVSISRHADYQTNAAMLLAKALKKPAVDVANEIAAALQASGASTSLISGVTMSAGFVNLSLSDAYLNRRLERVVQSPYACHQNNPEPATSSPRALVDFSSPNMGKELHVGHLRSSVIGDTVARILQYTGYNVDRVSHIGDAGVPLALLMTAYLEQEAASQSKWRQLSAQQLLAAIEEPSASVVLPIPAEFSELYARAKKRMDRITETEYAARVQSTLRTLQTVLASRTSSKPPASLPEDQLYIYALWRMICHVSRANIQPLLDLLNVSVQERGESTYLPDVENVVAGLLASNAATVTQGAVGIFVDGADKPPFLLRKADGGHLYAAIDMAAMHHRLSAGYDRVVYVTDAAQSSHFRQLFQAAKAAGWVAKDGLNKLSPKPKRTSLEHAAFGVVTGVDGKKLSSRAGTEYTLHGLLHDGIAQVTSSMQQTAMSTEEKARTASAIACGAIRYYDLSHNRKSNYEFSFDRVLSLKGNTAAYLMYATTRLSSLRRQFAVAQKFSQPEPTWEEILTFVQSRQTAALGTKSSVEWAPTERALALELLRFPESVQHASKALLPNVFTDYLHNLATSFHGFYEACRVVPADSAELSQPATLSRIALCAATENTLRAGFSLVGISHVSRM